MSKRLLAFRAGAARTIKRPWVRTPEWTPSKRVYRKEGGTWVEWWPLLPHAPLNVTGVFSYRNDRIELDIDWDEPPGPETASYQIEVLIDGRERFSYTQTDDSTLTPDRGWQEYAGSVAVISVTGISPFDEPGETALSGNIRVLQLPPPPEPTNLVVDIVDRGATATWDHVGGNRLSGFVLRTSYKVTTKRTTTDQDARSKDVTHWNTREDPGDPGGEVGVLIRAVGIGGKSEWVSDQGQVPNVPNPPPPPAVKLPGAPVITGHRFKDGVLQCNYRVPNGVGVRIAVERYNKSTLTYGTQSGATGTITIGASSGWGRNMSNRYRIRLIGYNSKNQDGPKSRGVWARKVYNPFYITPYSFVSMRGAYPDGEHYNFGAGYDMPKYLRQGSSYNTFSWRTPEIDWRGFVNYDPAKLGKDYVGFSLTVSSAEILAKRHTSGGLGSSVRPRLWFHGYGARLGRKTPGTSLFGSSYLYSLARGASRWMPIPRKYARRLADPDDGGVDGVAVYNPGELRSWLGYVSESYMIMEGPGTKVGSWPCWTIRVYHDG